MTINPMRILRVSVALALLAPVAACSDVLSLDVESPGRIADDDLNNRDAQEGLVAGMSYDLSQAFDSQLQEVVMAGGELWHGGSYNFGTIPRGILQSEASLWDGAYGSMSQARWVAEQGLKRMFDVLGSTDYERSALVARAYLLAGFANRVMGEVQCESTIDGGPVVANTEHFVRADSLFSRAIQIGGAANQSAIVNAAYAGRASARAWQGQWSAADADAAMVPASFEYFAIFNTSPGAVNNDLVYETTSRKEFTVYSTMWENITDDPRVPWEIQYDNTGQVEVGQDGETPFYQQQKLLTQDSDIRLTHGSEMLVLRAEAALRSGSIDQMVNYLDQGRAVYGMDPIETVPANTADAWALLRVERAATLWLEGRRLWDLRRWNDDGGVIADPFSQGRELCFPISDEEQRVNSNIQ
jgi:hypothetical protein